MRGAAGTAREIEQLLAAHAGEPVDYVAMVMLLNTVAGGHYEERHSEDDIQRALEWLLREGRIEAVAGGEGSTFRLPGSPR